MKAFYNSDAHMVICLVGPLNTGQIKVLHHIDAKTTVKPLMPQSSHVDLKHCLPTTRGS